MKTWTNAEIEVLDVKSTAYGPENPEKADLDKYAVYGDKGELLGWEAGFGDNGGSQNN